MRRTHSWVVVLSLAGLVAVACGGGGETGEEAFEIPSNAEEIGSTGLYLPRAEPATLPRPTSGASTLRIMGVTATRTGQHSFSVHVDVESTATIAYAYLDFGADGVFKVPTTPVTTAPTPRTTWVRSKESPMMAANRSSRASSTMAIRRWACPAWRRS